MKISVIIPVYNEQRDIRACVQSLLAQINCNFELIIVDDGSTDRTLEILKDFKDKLIVLTQDHKGPGAARNFGAMKSSGEILVFVDADMEFEKDFLQSLTKPIQTGKVVGTFSKQEYLLNRDNPLARCWNLNLGRKSDHMISENAPDTQEVFRAILKSKFESVKGFDINVGYTDDWSLSRKLQSKAVAVEATYYHRNPDNYQEIWKQARWFGKNEFLTGSFVRKVFNLIRYLPIIAPFKGLYRAVKFNESSFILFQIVYDTAVFTSVLKSFFKEHKNK